MKEYEIRDREGGRGSPTIRKTGKWVDVDVTLHLHMDKKS
jgi:hypothetical protein